MDDWRERFRLSVLHWHKMGMVNGQQAGAMLMLSHTATDVVMKMEEGGFTSVEIRLDFMEGILPQVVDVTEDVQHTVVNPNELPPTGTKLLPQ